MSQQDAGREGFADLALLLRAFQLSKMLQAAAALDLADRVAAGPQSVAKLASDCGADQGTLLRMCRALAAFGIFKVAADGLVSQTIRSAWLRKDAKPTLYHAARYWTTQGNWQSWANLEHAIKTGGSPFQATFGVANFDYLAAHPEEASLFDLFMQHSPDDRHAAVVQAYDFSDAGLIVDVGGGNGALLCAILAANPGVNGVLFDQPDVVSAASQVLNGRGLAKRCRIEAGNFLETIPEGGDIYTLSQILHDWDDAHCVIILANCRAAMRPDARLLVIERVLQEEPGLTNPTTYLADMHMMVIHSGKERTAAEFETLLAQSGLGTRRTFSTKSPFCIIEARPL